jgi:hypothetical protein
VRTLLLAALIPAALVACPAPPRPLPPVIAPPSSAVPSATPAPPSATPATSDRCGHSRDDEPPAEQATSLDDVVARKPRSGRFTTEGWLQNAHHCPECPPGADCKPCNEIIWLSAVRGAYKDGLSREFDLMLSVPDARRFEMLRHYRVVFVACGWSSDPAAPLTAELRGFALLP